MNRRRQRGFTLIELMIALVVSSLLVGMILAIFSRMSLAYRGQQQIAGLQQVIAAARATIELDARQAGFAMAQGFRLATDPTTARSPVQIINSSTGPDQIALFYADATTQAVVTDATAWPGPIVGVDSTEGFAEGDLVVMSTADVPTLANPINPGADAKLATYDACVLQIAQGGVHAGSPGTLRFSVREPWGAARSEHCTPPVAQPPPGATTLTTMIYKLVAHAYRIDPDPARAAIGALQGSRTGGLLGAEDEWTDLAYGFTDIQTALQVYDGDGIDTPDPGTDGDREWYSGETQAVLTASSVVAPAGLLQLSISLVARTDREVEGIATAATPSLVVAGTPDVDGTEDHNTIGDHASEALPWAIDPTLPGRVYRYTTCQIDLRNLGVGR
jgi:prepilin-type N-terminal cleavage/methylation domain-containing protein